jgi:hypothetical protein
VRLGILYPAARRTLSRPLKEKTSILARGRQTEYPHYSFRLSGALHKHNV